MKRLLLLTVAIAACSASATKDPMLGYEEGDRYFYFSGDDNDTLQLVDAEEPVDQEFIDAHTRNPDNNGYWLFTRANPTTRQIIEFGDVQSVQTSNFNFSKVTAFLAHGWNGHAGNAINRVLIEALLYNADVNVIVLDWSVLAKGYYPTAKGATAAVGRGLGQFVNWLAKLGLSYERVHLIGFSLGGQLVGSAGRETKGKVKRITALDPAGPLWLRDKNRLRPTDGQYVEVIHTDTKLLGYREPCGDADFYPNGGSMMPGCRSHICFHNRAYEYFASSVKYNHLIAKECKTLREATHNGCTGSLYPMGNSDLFKSRKGIFRVNTRPSYPY